MKTFIVIALLIVAIYFLLCMLYVLGMNKNNSEEFRKAFQEHIDATYAKHGGVIDYHLDVAKLTRNVCFGIIIFCILALIF